MLWYFLGQPDVEDIKDFVGDLPDKIRDFGDFSDVLGCVLSINLLLLLPRDDFYPNLHAHFITFPVT